MRKTFLQQWKVIWMVKMNEIYLQFYPNTIISIKQNKKASLPKSDNKLVMLLKWNFIN